MIANRLDWKDKVKNRIVSLGLVFCALALGAGCQKQAAKADPKVVVATKDPSMASPNAKNDAPVESKIAWLTNYDEAVAESQKTGKPIMIDFWADWCTYCKALDRESYSDAEVAEACKAFVPLKLDGDHEGRPLAEKYFVQGFPTILFIDAEGKDYTRMSYRPRDMFLESVKQTARNINEYNSAKKALASAPDDKVSLVKLSNSMAEMGQSEGAETVLAKAEKAGAEPSELSMSYIALGSQALMQKEIVKAKGLLKKAATYGKPVEVKIEATISYGIAQAQDGQIKEALATFEQAAKIPGIRGPQLQKAQKLIAKAQGDLAGGSAPQ